MRGQSKVPEVRHVWADLGGFGARVGRSSNKLAHVWRIGTDSALVWRNGAVHACVLVGPDPNVLVGPDPKRCG